MTIEKPHTSSPEKHQEGQKLVEKVLGKDVITSTKQNDQVDRIKVLDAIKSFKLTADGQQSFTLDFGNGNSLKDSRASRKPSEDERTVLASGTKTNVEHQSLDRGTLQTTDKAEPKHSHGERIPSERRNWHHGRSDFPDYSHKDVRTNAPGDVVVIGAEGLPGKLYEDGKKDPLELQDIIDQIGEIQAKKKQGKDDPKLVYIQACHSGEDAHGGSVASQIAKATHSYVVGNLGFGDSENADTTKPNLRIPGTDIIIPDPSGAHDKVRLFNSEGQPIGDFKTPVDWKEVKKAEQDDILKHKR
jgi:hypothetical protein